MTTLLTALALAAAAQEGPTLDVWPGEVPGGLGGIDVEAVRKKRGPDTDARTYLVTEPTLTLYRPETPNGCAVVVCPGGGYTVLAHAHEGVDIARWLNTLGVTAALLEYRVPRRDREAPHAAPLQDAQRAIRLVRKHAKAWRVDPGRVGILGFSAGGHLTVMAGTQWDRRTYEPVDDADELDCRPDFMIPIYAAYLGSKEDPFALSPLVRVTERTPPAFMAVTFDDKHRAVHAALLLAELKRHGVSAELHVYSKGGHGYGIRPSENPVSTWHRRCGEWLRVSGLLEPAKE